MAYGEGFLKRETKFLDEENPPPYTFYVTSSFGRTRPRRGKETVSASGLIHYFYVYAVLAAASTILFREKGCPITQDPSVFAR